MWTAKRLREKTDRPAVMVNAAESVWVGVEGVGRMTGDDASGQPGSILGPAEQRMWERLVEWARGSAAH